MFQLRSWVLSLCVLSAGLFAPWQAQASTLPKADLKRHFISLGSAPSIGGEISLSPEWAIGASTAFPIFYSNFGFLRYGAHTSYQVLQADQLTIRLLAGVFGDLNTPLGQELQLSPIGVQAGLIGAYQFNQWFTGRINFVAGIGFPRSTGFGLFPPGGGLELAFHPFPQFEACLGFNGNGDIVSLRFNY